MEALQYLEPMTWTAIEIAVPVVVLAILFWRSGVVRYIPNDRLGILEKLWSFRGSVSNGFIALNREAGYQPEVVRGGLHFFMPFQYSIHRANLVTIRRVRSAMSLPVMASRCLRRRHLLPTPTPTISRMCAAFSKKAGRKDRNARSCVKAPMPSISRNSSC
ncbi:hypothetical protein ABID25_003337 [Mesorhizobium abyssinicae]